MASGEAHGREEPGNLEAGSTTIYRPVLQECEVWDALSVTTAKTIRKLVCSGMSMVREELRTKSGHL